MRPGIPGGETSGGWAAPIPAGPAEIAPSPFRTAGPAAGPRHAAPAAGDPFRTPGTAPGESDTADTAPIPVHGAEPTPEPFPRSDATPPAFYPQTAPDPFRAAAAGRRPFSAADVAGPGAAGPEAPAAGAAADDLWVPVPRARTAAALVVPALVGAAVAVTLGVYARLHDPAGQAVRAPGFSSAQTFKVWLATGSAALAVVQVLSALALYGRLGRLGDRPWLPAVHRHSGRLAFLLAVPVAVHCLYALGFQTYEPRVLVHSLVGCLFFGAFTVKMLSLSKERMPGWVLPLLGGLVFTALVTLWLTSSLWFFTTIGVLR